MPLYARIKIREAAPGIVSTGQAMKIRSAFRNSLAPLSYAGLEMKARQLQSQLIRQTGTAKTLTQEKLTDIEREMQSRKNAPKQTTGFGDPRRDASRPQSQPGTWTGD